MKTAVIFTNHLRTLPLSQEVLKSFYPPTTDYFLCTWDEDYWSSTAEETRKLMSEHNASSFMELKYTPHLFRELDQNKLLKVQEFFNFKKTCTLTRDEFYSWYNEHLLKYFGQIHPRTLFHYFRRFVKQKAWELVENLRSNYDLIVFHRCDLVPYPSDKKFTDYDFSYYDLFTYKFRFFKNVLHFDDNILIGTPETLQSIFENSFEKIEELTNNPLYSGRTNLLKSHRLEAALVLFSNPCTTGAMPFSYKKFSKDFNKGEGL